MSPKFCQRKSVHYSFIYLYTGSKRLRVVAHERLTGPRVTMEWLLAKPRSFSNLTAFLDLMVKKFNKNRSKKLFWKFSLRFQKIWRNWRQYSKSHVIISNLKMKLIIIIWTSIFNLRKPKLTKFCGLVWNNCSNFITEKQGFPHHVWGG